MNLYEVSIESVIENLSLIEALLFQCKCVLFLIDITRKVSFKLVKDLINIIDFDKFYCLNGIIVLNKSDLIYRENSEIEKIKYLQKNKNLEYLEISIKNYINLEQLLKRINNYLNKFLLPVNIISEKKWEKNLLIQKLEYLSFVLIGESISGKTRFLKRYFKNIYSEYSGATIGIDKEIKFIKFDNNIYKLTVWDSAGLQRFRNYPPNFRQMANADAVLILFDVTNLDSFNEIMNYWIKVCREESCGIICLIGNKIDCPERKISKEQAEKFANSFCIKYFEISCKYNINISEVISNMILECLLRSDKINNKNIIRKALNLYLNKIKILDKYINY